MSDGDLLKTPGEMLREARLRGDFGINEISARTRIPPPMLEAIERDEYHRLSDPLYVKSFLRAYAAEVGLDPAEVVALHGRMTGATGPAAAEPGADVWEEEAVTITRVGVPWLRILGVAGALVVLAAVIVFLATRGGDGTADRPAGMPMAAPGAASAGDHAARRESLLAAADTGSAGVATEEEGAGLGGVVAAAEPVEAEPAVVAPPVNLPAAAVGDDRLRFRHGVRWPVVLRVVASQPVAVTIRRDGEVTFRTTHLPGDEVPSPLPREGLEAGRAYAAREGAVAYWGARDHFSIKLDHTEGVEVRVNGSLRDVQRLRPGREMILDAHGGAGR